MNSSQKAQYRYAGRALALIKLGKFERVSKDDGTDQYKYRSPQGGATYLVDVTEDLGICNCAEYKVNLHLAGATAKGKRVMRNPGPVCKHIIACRVLASTPGADDAFDLHAVIEAWDDKARKVAKLAYFDQFRRLAEVDNAGS